MIIIAFQFKKRENTNPDYFDCFEVETSPKFFTKNVNLGSDERIQDYDESYCIAFCLYMIYSIDYGFKIASALSIPFNKSKSPWIYD